MFVVIMIVFATWARDQSAPAARGGWLESVRLATLDRLAAGPAASSGAAETSGPRRRSVTADDDEHLAAYNAYLARLNPDRDDRPRGPANHGGPR
jgi:hypothetical protein